MKENPILRRARERGDTGHGSLSEKRIAKSLSARLTPASGAKIGAKGDMVKVVGGEEFLIEAKSTKNTTMSVDLGWLVKIANEALDKGDKPVLSISFVTPEGKPKQHGEWIAIPRWVADQYLFNK